MSEQACWPKRRHTFMYGGTPPETWWSALGGPGYVGIEQNDMALHTESGGPRRWHAERDVMVGERLRAGEYPPGEVA